MIKIFSIIFIMLTITLFGCIEQNTNPDSENKVEKNIQEETTGIESILVAGSFFCNRF